MSVDSQWKVKVALPGRNVYRQDSRFEAFIKKNIITNEASLNKSKCFKRSIEFLIKVNGQGHTYLREMLTSRIQSHWKVKVTPTLEKCWPPGSKAIGRSRSHLPGRNVDLQDPRPLKGQGHTYLGEMLTSRIQGHWKVKVTPTWEKCWPPGSKVWGSRQGEYRNRTVHGHSSEICSLPWSVSWQDRPHCQVGKTVYFTLL